MFYTKVDNLPERAYVTNANPKQFFEEFMESNVEMAKVHFNKDEYSSTNGALASLRDYIKRHNLPVDAKMVNGEVYLIRRNVL